MGVKGTMEKSVQKYEGCPGATMYVERFGNYREFIETLNKRLPEERKNNPSGCELGSWYGVNSWDEAYKLLLEGWDKPVRSIEMNFDHNLMKVREKARRKTFSSVAGFAPIPAHAVMNLPNSMLDQKMESRKTKVLDFLIMIDRACSHSAQEIEERMSKQLAGIAALERDYGYRCRISVSFAAFSGYPRGGKANACCVLKVKDESQPFDIKRLAFPIAHAAMLRALMFRWERTLTAEGGIGVKYNQYHETGLGTAYERWPKSDKDRFVGMASDGKSKMIVLDFNSNVEEVIENKRKEVGAR